MLTTQAVIDESKPTTTVISLSLSLSCVLLVGVVWSISCYKQTNNGKNSSFLECCKEKTGVNNSFLPKLGKYLQRWYLLLYLSSLPTVKECSVPTHKDSEKQNTVSHPTTNRSAPPSFQIRCFPNDSL